MSSIGLGSTCRIPPGAPWPVARTGGYRHQHHHHRLAEAALLPPIQQMRPWRFPPLIRVSSFACRSSARRLPLPSPLPLESLPAVFGSPSARVSEPRAGCRPYSPRGPTDHGRAPSLARAPVAFEAATASSLGALTGASAGALSGSEWRPALCIRAASALVLRSPATCLRALPVVRPGHHVDGHADLREPEWPGPSQPPFAVHSGASCAALRTSATASVGTLFRGHRHGVTSRRNVA
jgi:hypothetical protein